MLRITRGILEQKDDIALEVKDDFIDVAPLFKLSFPRKRAETYMATNAHRREYVKKLDKKLGKPSLYTETQPRKRRFYHKKLVKVLLYALDLLDLEEAIASVWNSTTLPMLDDHQFSHSKINLTFYDDYGRETKHDVRIMERAKDGWMNITFGLRNHDGSSKKTTATVTKNKQTLFRRLYKIDNNVDDVFALINGLTSKTEKTTLETNKRELQKLYVDSESNTIETWVEPNVFYSALLDCSIDFHKSMTRTMSALLFNKQYDLPHTPSDITFELITDERRNELQKEIETQLVVSRDTRARHAKEANKIKREARILGLTSERLNAVNK
jgi:hypothetical protein